LIDVPPANLVPDRAAFETVFVYLVTGVSAIWHNGRPAASLVSGVEPLTSHGSRTGIGRGKGKPNFFEPEEAMNPPSSTNASMTPEQPRRPEIGPALKRDRLLQRVRAARKRLSPAPSGTLAKLP
jgi:hypothetical protein